MDLKQLVIDIIRLILPWKNETPAQKTGTVVTILVLVLTFLLQFIPAPPVNVQNAPQSLPDVPSVDSPDVPVTGILVSCSAAQKAIMQASSADLLACFLNVGVSEANVALYRWGDGYKIDAEAIGADALGKAIPCLLKWGAVAVSTYAIPPGRWGGSAGEANVFRGDGYRIVVTPQTSTSR